MNQTNHSLTQTSHMPGSAGTTSNGLPPLPDPSTFVPGKSSHQKPESDKGKNGKADKPKKEKVKADKPKHRKGESPVRYWFLTFMTMNIPVIGWIYLLYLAYSKKKTDRRNFARAYLLYKLVFLIIAATILGILTYIGMGLLEQLMAYMEML